MATTVIDLEQYGMEGTVEMGMPSQRNITMMNNALGNCSVTKMVDGEPVIVETRVGDADLIKMLVYVRRAPFNNTVKSFLDYCDKMEPGMDVQLCDRMTTVAKAYREGGDSPFVSSQAEGTQSSD